MTEDHKGPLSVEEPAQFARPADKSTTWQPANGRFEYDVCAINCTTRLSTPVLDLVLDSLAENTRRAYRFDLATFEAWGGQIPADPGMVASYIAAHAGLLSAATLARRLVAISKAHDARNLPNPVKSEIVRATLRGVRRRHGVAQREARPLIRDGLVLTLSRMGETMKDVRDRALLLIGFAGGFRRSELAKLSKPAASGPDPAQHQVVHWPARRSARRTDNKSARSQATTMARRSCGCSARQRPAAGARSSR